MQFSKRMPKNDSGMLFVYGSLKRGFHNHSYLQGARFFGEGRTRPEFDLLDFGEFPAAVRPGQFAIFGEIHKVDRNILYDVDLIEGEGILYKRVLAEIISGGSEISCWLYILIERDAGLRPIAPLADGVTKIWRRR